MEENKNFKSGFVSLIGRTNVGKSTLLNGLVGEKVAITTNKTQTTRTAIKAILNDEKYQIIITDTPGIHKPKTKLSETMIETAFTSFGDVDVILFLIEVDSKEIGRGDLRIIEKIKESKKPCILVINKIDLIEKSVILKLIDMYKNEYDFKAIVPISASQKQGFDELIKEILEVLPHGPKYFDTDEYTDQTMRQMTEEIIREKALRLLNDEVPHGIYVEVESFKERKTTKGQNIIDIEATIYCLRESHKGIIIGKGGNMLKRIASFARSDLEKQFDTKVNLKVWVKVKPDWQENDSIVKKFKGM